MKLAVSGWPSGWERTCSDAKPGIRYGPGGLGERVAVGAVAELEVGAVVVDHLDAQPGEDAVGGHRPPDVVVAVAREVLAGREVVDAVLHELHGAARALRQHRGDA